MLEPNLINRRQKGDKVQWDAEVPGGKGPIQNAKDGPLDRKEGDIVKLRVKYDCSLKSVQFEWPPPEV